MAAIERQTQAPAPLHGAQSQGRPSHGAAKPDEAAEAEAAIATGHAIQVAAFYHFCSLTDLPELRQELQQLATAETLRGTILLASEGVNGTVSGPPRGVDRLLSRLRSVPGLEPLEAKFSWAPQQAFQRLKVRIKREIVTMGCPTVKPAEEVGHYVPPAQWDALIDDPGTLVIDTRNRYEVAIGTFEGAVDPGTDSFREFPQWVERELRPLVAQRQPRAIAMFCTGGIRCEKATAYLLQQGFEQVHHLQGGILRYLEERPEQDSRWQGECFVFDQRVSVNHRLEPGRHRLCHACGLPLAPEELQHPAYREGVSCHHCIRSFSEADRARFAERQRQIVRAKARGERHLGAAMPPQQDRTLAPPTAAEAGTASIGGVETMARTILYSFRRCPYAIRARLALEAAGLRPGLQLELREVSLQAKPPELLAASAKGTVPVMERLEPTAGEDRVLADSLAIMRWALQRSDPQRWTRDWSAAEQARIEALIAENDGPFKRHLDRFKYAARFGETGLREQPQQRQEALAILREWNRQLQPGGWLLGHRPSLADVALQPFVRQFRLADPSGFDTTPGLEALQTWLQRFLASEALHSVMHGPWAPRRPWHSPSWLYHLALSEEWHAGRAAGVYARSSRGLALEQVGFIHASYAHQIAATHGRFYADLPAGAVRLLTLDPARLAAAGVAVVAEPAPESGELFPHLYGAIPIAAVLQDAPYPG